MFIHLAKNHFGTDLLLDEIQASAYKMLDSMFTFMFKMILMI